MENKNIIVERELIEKNNKTFYTYFIKGNVRGTDVRIAVVPHDFGGYTVLDIVFGSQLNAELVVSPFEIKDDSGKLVKGNTFAVRSVDENGTSYECPIKPFRTSDKALLNMLLN